MATFTRITKGKEIKTKCCNKVKIDNEEIWDYCPVAHEIISRMVKEIKAGTFVVGAGTSLVFKDHVEHCRDNYIKKENK